MPRLRPAAAIGLLVAIGCGGPSLPEPRSSVELPDPDPELAEGTRDVVLAAERRGWVLERVGEARFEVEARAHVQEVVVPAGTCRAFVLIGAAGVREAAAALYLPDGSLLGRDTRGDPPRVGACAGDAPLAAFWHVSVRGAGLVRGLTFAVPAADAAEAGLSEPPAPEEGLARSLQRRGFVRRADRRISLQAGEERRFPVVLGAHRCATLWATGLEVRLTLLRGEEPLAREGTGGEGALQLCAARDELRLVGAVRASESGEVRVRTYEADADVVGGEAGLWLGERRPARVERRAEVPDATLHELVPGEVREAALPAHERCVPVRLDAGEGSRGVWLDEPTGPGPSAERCVAGARVRFGSVGGGRVWLRIGGETAPRQPSGATRRRPARQRGARP